MFAANAGLGLAETPLLKPVMFKIQRVSKGNWGKMQANNLKSLKKSKAGKCSKIVTIDSDNRAVVTDFHRCTGSTVPITC